MDSEVSATIASLVFIIVVAIVFLALSVKVVKPYERLVVFRLGRTNSELVRPPGLRFVIPFIDRPVRVDMREQVVEVASRSSATRGGQEVDLDARVGYRVNDPLALVLSVGDLRGSLRVRAMTLMVDLIGESSNEDVRFRRGRIAADLRDRLNADTERWGVTITDVALS